MRARKNDVFDEEHKIQKSSEELSPPPTGRPHKRPRHVTRCAPVGAPSDAIRVWRWDVWQTHSTDHTAGIRRGWAPRVGGASALFAAIGRHVLHPRRAAGASGVFQEEGQGRWQKEKDGRAKKVPLRSRRCASNLRNHGARQAVARRPRHERAAHRRAAQRAGGRQRGHEQPRKVSRPSRG